MQDNNSSQASLDSVTPSALMCPIAQEICEASFKKWGRDRPAELLGLSPKFQDCLEKLKKFARFNQPILITGESGVGKELFAKACYLLSNRTEESFVSLNCPQYGDGNITVSELFGHTRGSFTGALSDHTGLFEVADRGTIFLDEIGDLPANAQTLLLRALAENEVKPLGSNKIRKVNVRVIAATNRDLRTMIKNREFREDLYFRLRYFPLDIPPLREREDDWRLLAQYFVARLNAEYKLHKAFSPISFRFLEGYPWPGNIRELRSIATIGYSMAESKYIEPDHFVSELQQHDWKASTEANQNELFGEMLERGRSFWDVVQAPFLDREINRSQVREIISQGLVKAMGSYRRLGLLFNIPPDQYHKFMDFLRHHRLKPDL
jgi:transcriptional regulator with GAF, ATPase, and Fis domain